MARNERIRLSSEEKGRVEQVRQERFGEESADDIPLGYVIGQLAAESLEAETGGGDG